MTAHKPGPASFNLSFLLFSLFILFLLTACGTDATPTPASNPISPAEAGSLWNANFSYTHSIIGKATGNNVTVEQNEAESYQGQLSCTVAAGDNTGTSFDCNGTGKASYSSLDSCTDTRGVTSHEEEAQPWSGAVRGTLTFDWQAKSWSLTVQAPPMQIHLTDTSIGKVDKTDSSEQVISDLYIADEKLNPDGHSGTHHESGAQTDDLQFGSCDTGVNASTEKAGLDVVLGR